MIVLKNGTVYDGTGAAPLQADVLIDGERIAEIAPNLRVPEGACVIDAAGKVVTPGFVDIHRHPDVAVLQDSDFGSTELAQGITSIIGGNCGLSPIGDGGPQRGEWLRYLEPVVGYIRDEAPFASYSAYAAALKKQQLPLNVGFLAGTGALKAAVKGFSKTPFSAQEKQRVSVLIREAFDSGALGVSFGIMYQPECYSSREELIFMAKEAKKNGAKVMCTHIRCEGSTLPESVQEVIDIAKEAQLALNVSHFKVTGIDNWGKTIFRAIELIEDARAKGQTVTADFYPYNGGSTTLLSLVPPTVMEADPDALYKKLATSEGKNFFKQELAKEHAQWDNMALSIGWDRICISSVSLAEHESFCGKTIAALAAENHADCADITAGLLADERGRVGIILLSMSQNDIDTIAKLPWTHLISDSLYCAGATPHPRLNGAFPKFLRDFVRERGLITFTDAIRKMTSMCAQCVSLPDRGVLRKGAFADVLVFDANQFTDHADYSRPTEKATGMDTVILNGRIVTEQKNGRFLSR